MNNYRALLDEEIGTSPPTTVDIERRIVRQRWRLRYQQAAVATTAIGLSVLAVAGFAQLPRANGSSLQVGAPPDPAATSPTPTPSDIEGSKTAARLTAALRQGLGGPLPGARYASNRVRGEEVVDALVFNHRLRANAPDRTGEDYYIATADITFAAGRGSILVTVGELSPSLYELPRECSEGPLDVDDHECKASTGPAGETILEETISRSKSIVYRVFVIRLDGVGISIQVNNSTGVDSRDSNRSDAPTPPLTMKQVRTLALSPTLTI